MLKIEHISKTFNPGTVNEKQAIRDLSLNLEKGDFATIIGSNGAGKSTLFNAICGDFLTDSGVIMLDGQDITFMPQHVRAKTIGRLYQDPMRGTAPGMTIEENLALAAGKGGWLSHVSRQEKERFHEELKLLAETGTGVCHCPASNMKLSSGIARIPDMLKLGVPVGLGVDGSASNDGSSLMEELRVAFLLHRLNSSKAAPSGYDVLKMATRGSARLLGRSDDIGTLEVGKCCDLFMIDSRRLELVGSCFDPTSVLGTVGVRGPVDYTVVHGRVTVEHGHLVTVDEEKLAHDAEAKCRAYLNR